MTELAVDYAAPHVSPAAIKAAGARGVIRYGSHSSWKNLTTLEASLLRAVGLWVALVWETSPTRVNTGGHAGGFADADDANAFASALHYPAGAVMFYACDTTPNQATAFAYFAGARDAHSTRPIGWYGGMQVGLALKAAGLVDVVWVANAASWSGYPHFDELEPVALRTAGVSMLQSTAHPLVGLDPASYDLDELVVPFPAWGVAVAPPAPPKPIPPIVRIPGVTMDITSLPLDEHGNGQVAVPGVAPNDVKSLTVVGLHDPSDKPMGYTRLPRYALDTHTGTAEIVLEDGVPFGRYVIRVEHA